MSFRDNFLKAITTAAFVLTVCWLVFGCGDDGGNPAKPPMDDGLAGDWLVYDGNNEKGVITLSSSGELFEGTFKKAGDFWIEGLKEGTATWGASRTRREFYIISSVWTDTMQYELSGNIFITTACYDNICYENRLKRIDLADFKSNLGTVYANDRNLYTSTKYNDLAWYLQGDKNNVIDFDAIYFDNDGDRYVTGSSSGIWYTSDSRLFLLNVQYDCGNGTDDCKATILKSVEAKYEVTVNAKLSIRPILPGGGLGAEDIWLPISYAGRNSAAKPRLNDNNGGKHAFSPLARLTGGRR